MLLRTRSLTAGKNGLLSLLEYRARRGGGKDAAAEVEQGGYLYLLRTHCMYVRVKETRTSNAYIQSKVVNCRKNTEIPWTGW